MNSTSKNQAETESTKSALEHEDDEHGKTDGADVVQEDGSSGESKKRVFSEISPSSTNCPSSSSQAKEQSKEEPSKVYVPVPNSATFDWNSPITPPTARGFSFAQGVRYRHDVKLTIEHQDVFKRKSRPGKHNLVRTSCPLSQAVLCPC